MRLYTARARVCLCVVVVWRVIHRSSIGVARALSIHESHPLEQKVPYFADAKAGVKVFVEHLNQRLTQHGPISVGFLTGPVC